MSHLVSSYFSARMIGNGAVMAQGSEGEGERELVCILLNSRALARDGWKRSCDAGVALTCSFFPIKKHHGTC